MAAPRLEAAGELPTFLKGCAWSPDGLCILAASDAGRLHLFNTPHHLVAAAAEGAGAGGPGASAGASGRVAWSVRAGGAHRAFGHARRWQIDIYRKLRKHADRPRPTRGGACG